MDAKKLIVVEADNKFGKALQLYFRGSPYRPYVTADAAEAVEMAQRQRPNLIVMCLENEKHDMFEMVGNLKENDATSSIPIILISSKLSEEEVQSDSRLKGKFNSYLKKPFVKKAMLQAVEEVLGDGQGAAPPPSGESAAKMPSSDGVDLNQIFSEIDEEIDEFFEKSEPPSGAGPAAQAQAPAPAREASSPSGEYSRVTDSGEYRDLEQRYRAKSGEVNDLRDRLRTLERELRTKSDEVKVIGAKGTSVQLEKIKVLEKKIADHEDDRTRHTQKINQLSEMIRSLNEELEQNNRKYKDEIDQATQTNFELRSQIAELSEKVEATERDVKGREAEIEDLGKEIEEQRAKISEGDAQIARLREEIQINVDRQQELSNQLHSENERAAGLSQEIDSLKSQVEKLRGRMAEARTSMEAGLKTLASE